MRSFMDIYIYTHTHTHIYIYIYVRFCYFRFDIWTLKYFLSYEMYLKILRYKLCFENYTKKIFFIFNEMDGILFLIDTN